MKRVCIWVVLFGAAGLASAQNLLTDSGFDNAAKWFASSDKTGGINSFDWSAAAWATPPEQAGGTYQYYTPNVPAGTPGVWWVNPDTFVRATGGQNGPTDNWASFIGVWRNLKVLQCVAAPAAGTRLLLKSDYLMPVTAPGDAQFDVEVYGMLNNNPTRTPFQINQGTNTWDLALDGTPLQTTVLPGPDVAHTWGSGLCSVALLTTMTTTHSATWATVSQVFFLTGTYNFLEVQGNIDGNDGVAGDPRGFDNLQLIKINKGDTNGDRQVNGDDFVTLAVNYTGTGVTGKNWSTATSTRTATWTATTSSPWPSTTPAPSTPFPSPSACACWAWAAWRCSAAATNCRISRNVVIPRGAAWGQPRRHCFLPRASRGCV